MTDTVQNGKGSDRRPEDSKRVERNWDQIKWASGKRRDGRAGSVIPDKTKYSRKRLKPPTQD